MGRRKQGPKVRIYAYIPDEVLIELITLRPELVTFDGNLRYGASTEYVVNLIREDLRSLREKVRAAVTKLPE